MLSDNQKLMLDDDPCQDDSWSFDEEKLGSLDELNIELANHNEGDSPGHKLI
jgi:hypothetical protein